MARQPSNPGDSDDVLPRPPRPMLRSVTPPDPIKATADESGPNSVWPPDSDETPRLLRAIAQDLAEHRAEYARDLSVVHARLDRQETTQALTLVRLSKLETSVKRAGAIVSAVSATAPAWGPQVIDSIARLFGA